MAEFDTLPVDKENIKETPDRFAIDLQGNEFIFEIMWNPEGMFFSFNMYDADEIPIILGRRIVYGNDMLANIVGSNLPNVSIYPLDRSGNEEAKGITFRNFITPVKLVVVDNG